MTENTFTIPVTAWGDFLAKLAKLGAGWLFRSRERRVLFLRMGIIIKH
jgi:hypothetical protein